MVCIQVVLVFADVFFKLIAGVGGSSIAHIPQLFIIFESQHHIDIFGLWCAESYFRILKSVCIHCLSCKSSSFNIRSRPGMQNMEAISTMPTHNKPVVFMVQ